MPQVKVERNPGMPLDMGWVNSSHVNRRAVERRVAEHGRRRGIKKQWQLAWLLRVVTCLDLTTLKGDDTTGRVHRLCHKAITPVRQDITHRLGVDPKQVHVGAVCVYSKYVKAAKEYLKGTDINVAAVATGFPSGNIPLPQKLDEIRAAVADGADEIDIVISRDYAIKGEWEKIYEEVKQFREACGEAHMKTILATGELPTYRHVYKASLVCMMAGADFIKTSTGMEGVNATLEFGFVMARAIRDYYERTGYRIGLKPAGGIRESKIGMQWLILMMEELGQEWCYPNLFRIGASALLTDLERQLWYGSCNEHANMNYMPMS